MSILPEKRIMANTTQPGDMQSVAYPLQQSLYREHNVIIGYI